MILDNLYQQPVKNEWNPYLPVKSPFLKREISQQAQDKEGGKVCKLVIYASCCGVR